MSSSGLHLVIGASGQVGGAILVELERRELECIGTYCKTLPEGAALLYMDLAEPETVTSLIERLNPSHIYLTASYTHVDGCEENPDLSYAINVEGVKLVSAAAHKAGARLVYFSSDYVFDGTAGPYSEEAPVSPISVYGRHKVMAEEIVLGLAAGPTDSAGASGTGLDRSSAGSGTGSARSSADTNFTGALVVRTTVVYGRERQGKNFILRLLRSLAAGIELPVPADQIGTPTLNSDLASTAVELAIGDFSGVCNVAGDEICSRYDFARAAARQFDLDEDLLVPVETEMLNQKARRPLLGGLKLDKVRGLLGAKARLTGYSRALGRLRHELEEELA